jgi:transposase
MNQETRLEKRETTEESPALYMALELSNKTWKIAFSDGEKVRTVGVEAGDMMEFGLEVGKAKERFRFPEDVLIVSCYEAGRDGFWLHRLLTRKQIRNVVVDSSSIEVNRRKRRAKTDRIDAKKLVSLLVRYHRGEKGAWKVVRVPSVDQEDSRQLNRELENLKKERTLHRNRIRGLLVLQGLRVKNPSHPKFAQELETMRMWDGSPLPKGMNERLVREYERLRLVEEQIRGLEKEKAEQLKNPDTDALKQVAQLQTLKGIGPVISWTLVMEYFAWRGFKNRKEVAALAGLTPTPYDSGGMIREQGISKAGSARIRSLSVEAAWCWVRFQPESKLSKWFFERFAGGGSRMRRIGIVALARKLLVDLWRYVEYGVIPEGAIVS